MNDTQNTVVIGHPIAHSKSPLIHNYWLKSYGLAGIYEALDVPFSDLRAFTDKIRNTKYLGANVTIPHKTKILPFCDEITRTAKTLGAVNTLFLRQNTLIGDNTDAYGFLANLDQRANNWDATLSHAIVLGAGGAARAVLFALIERGAKSITILNRSLENAQELVRYFSPICQQSELNADSIAAFANYAPQTDFLVNTTSIGLNNTKFNQLNLVLMPSHALVHDIVYTPLQTPLLKDATQAGLRTIDGLGMLLHQAAPSFEKWYKIFPEVSDELRQLVIEQL